MAKRESTFLNMFLALFAVTFIAAFTLGFVYELTKDAIDNSKIKAQNEAISKILPEFDRLGDPLKVPDESGSDTLEFFPAYKNDKFVGVAVKTFSKKGFSGFISIMAGIDNSGNFSGYQVLEHAETPGLGSKMESWFSNTEKSGQCIIGKNPGSHQFVVTKDGGDIDAITASTISSRAFLDALVKAYNVYKEKENEISGITGE
ncbi:MAG: RnfABCDGE type electron transport complex subunit G [Prolixibacteraceae bacterium]|jgi:electron transport complex protein RnfG|nr:RnfABCDGE type electron transport complex subunit G [Prolixibacteraceae bacterium]NLO02322.1 RnfABCDGE type electron transport complex subunit G [Bacteroidales bacterium]